MDNSEILDYLFRCKLIRTKLIIVVWIIHFWLLNENTLYIWLNPLTRSVNNPTLFYIMFSSWNIYGYLKYGQCQ